MAQHSEQSAQDYAAIRIQLSPLRTRANEVSPLRRQVEDQEKEIRELRKLLAARPSYAAVARGEHLLNKNYEYYELCFKLQSSNS